MKPSKISYSESKESFDISTGLKSWRKAGVEIELDDDKESEAFAVAKNIVKSALKPDVDYNNILSESTKWTEAPYGMSPSQVSPTILPTIDYSAKEKVEKAIEDCKTPHELDLLMGDVAKHQLVPQYIEKKKQLK
jgi:hypothetical protein